MAELLTLARPYAKAAFAYASEQGATDNWSNALQVSVLRCKTKHFPLI